VLFVAAEGVVVLELEVELLRPAEVPRALVVLEDVLAVELLVHAVNGSGGRCGDHRPH
jgi:hypothetical protein